MSARYNCPQCSTVLSVVAALAAGQKIRCPKCSTAFAPVAAQEMPVVVPQHIPDMAPYSPPPTPAPTPQAPLPSFSPIGGQHSPRSKKWLWYVAPPAALLVLLGVVLLLWKIFAGGGASFADDLRYVPEECTLIVSMNMEEALAWKPYQDLRKEIPNLDTEENQFKKAIGVPLSSLRRMTAMAPEDPQDVVILARTKAPISAAEVKAGQEPRAFQKNIEYAETRVGMHTIYEQSFQLNFNDGPENGGGKRITGQAFAVVDSHTLLHGRAAALTKILQRDGKPALPQRMQKALASVDPSSTGIALIDVRSKVAKEGPGEMAILRKAVPGSDAILKNLECLAIEIRLGSEANVSGFLHCSDAGTAEDVRKLAEGGLVAARHFLKQDGKAPREVADVLDAIKLTTNGSQLTARTAIKPDPIVQSFKEWMKR